MTAHKHAEMIKAKVDNMDLVVFVNNATRGKWQHDDGMPIHEEFEYFMSLPKHKEAVLNCLNGGESQTDPGCGEFVDVCMLSDAKWNQNFWYMQDDYQSRIKPRKEKRWILYSESPLSMQVFTCEESCDVALSAQPPFERKQKIEIEVEV